jgi:glycosidase
MDLPPYPYIYEINTWPWLHRLSEQQGGPVELGTVRGAAWDEIAAAGFDAVWMMGVWERSPAGVAIARTNTALMESFRAALSDLRDDDIVGSPYCVRNYVVDAQLGGPSGLATARRELAQRGVGLVLDYVPNHVAPDHPWTLSHPDRFVRGTDDDMERDPASFVRVGSEVLANGRDPYFPAWPDVVQLNAFSADLRSGAIQTLNAIAEQCDGVRCDMAMLMMNDVFERTWGTRAGDRPDDDYWPAVIPAIRKGHPGFRFIAEAYWELEWALQQQGFDFTYDKRLYDRLLHAAPEEVRLHLCADPAYQAKLLRFLENHDEPRVASEMGAAREKAAAVTTLTQMGARLVHDGQADGYRIRLPVFLGRYPREAADAELQTFHRLLWTALRDRTFREGAWQLCDRWGWEGNDAAVNLVAWAWDGVSRWLVVVNLSDSTSKGLVRAPWHDLRGRSVRLLDPTNDVTYERSGDDLTDGLYVELGPWGWHLFRVD